MKITGRPGEGQAKLLATLAGRIAELERQIADAGADAALRADLQTRLAGLLAMRAATS
jgi:hypothetical protein